MAEEEIVSPTDIAGLMRNALIRFAKQNETTPTRIAVKIFFDGVLGALGYEMFLDGNPSKRLSFLKDILNKNADSFNRENLLNVIMLQGFMGAPPVLNKFAKEFNVEEPTDLHMMVATIKDEPVNAILLLYHGDTFLRQVRVNEFM